MKLTRFQWYRVGLILLLAVLIAAGLVLFMTTRQLALTVDNGSSKLEVLSSIGRVRLLAREMEMTRPATGTPQADPAAVRYGSTVKKTRAEIAELAKLTYGRPVQLERVALLNSLVPGAGIYDDTSAAETGGGGWKGSRRDKAGSGPRAGFQRHQNHPQPHGGG